MYYEIVVKWLNKSRKITLPEVKDKQSLIELLRQLFRFKNQQIIGVTGANGKFHDLKYLTQNLEKFNKQTIELVISQALSYDQETFPQIGDQNEFNIEPISFASNTPNEFQNDYNPLNDNSELYEHKQLPEEPQTQILGEIHDLKLFQQTVLQSHFTVIIQTNKASKKIDKLSLPYYHFKGKQNKIFIYRNQKKVCEMPILHSSWKDTQNIILNIMKSFSNISLSQKKETKLEEQRKPLGFGQKINSQGSNKQLKHRSFTKPKNSGQRRLDYFQQKLPRSQSSEEVERYDIPIIIRKSNNKIEKVTASYPLNQEQIQAVNSLMELEIQGLFTDDEINKVKMKILGQNSTVLKLFQDYSNQKLSVKELCQNLTFSLKRKDSVKN